MNRCWQSIGVQGDRSCPELPRYIHCRNCPVYSAGAVALLDHAPPDDYLAGWTRHLALRESVEERDQQSVVIFRVGAEWLALPTPVVEEVTRPLAIHTLPHRRRDVVLGVTNVRGELAPCVALGTLLGIGTGDEADAPADRLARVRYLVIRHQSVRVVCPVQDVHGIHRFSPRDLQQVPTTLAQAVIRHTKQLLPWRDRSVGVLDERLLFQTLTRSLA